MLGASGTTVQNSNHIARKLAQILTPLTQTESGEALYRHIEGLLTAVENNHRDVQDAYAGILLQLLGAIGQNLPPGSPLHVHTRLLQLRLTPPLSAAELAMLRLQVETYSQQLSQHPASNEIISAALTPLLSNFGITLAATHAVAPPELEPATDTPETAAELSAAPHVNSAYRYHLDQNRQGIQRVQELLAAQVQECAHQNEAFGTLLQEHLNVLRDAGDHGNVDSLRRTLTEEMLHLLEGHRKIASQLGNAQNYLQVIETDNARLNDELTRVHLLSLTDELTGLPNRRAFLRQLEDEVGRVQRYGNPLTLAVIDLDGFKDINDRYGHAVGDEVLKVYARTVLSVFRHHDMVARYGGEEFAVILPNTHSDGAVRALRKIQKRASECAYTQDNKARPLPTFSAGVALYRPGEAPENFIDRADQALYRAKQLGRNRVENDQPPSNVANME